MARLLTFRSVRHARRPLKSAAAWPPDIRLTTGVTPNPTCIGRAWPDMAKKNNWQSANAAGSLKRDYQGGGPIMKKLGMLGIIGGAAILTAVPFSLQWSQKNVTLSLDSAEAQVGRPPTATSVAGVSRRVHRR